MSAVVDGIDAGRFAEHGFLKVDRLVPESEVEWLRGVYDDLMAKPSQLKIEYQGATGVISQLFAPDLKVPELLQTEYVKRSTVLAAELLGVDEGDITIGGLMFIQKPATGGIETPWHQDEAYWNDRNADRCNSLSVWMPLDDASAESGCMQYVPGSHTNDVLEHVKPDGPVPLHLRDPYDTSTAVACELPAGGASIHHCRTLHYAEANTTGRPRRAMTSIYHGPPTARAEPLRKPWLDNGVI